MTTAEIRLIAALSPKGGNCFGIAFIKGVDERFSVIDKAIFIASCLRTRCATRQWTCEEQLQSNDCKEVSGFH